MSSDVVRCRQMSSTPSATGIMSGLRRAPPTYCSSCRRGTSRLAPVLHFGSAFRDEKVRHEVCEFLLPNTPGITFGEHVNNLVPQVVWRGGGPPVPGATPAGDHPGARRRRPPAAAVEGRNYYESNNNVDGIPAPVSSRSLSWLERERELTGSESE